MLSSGAETVGVAYSDDEGSGGEGAVVRWCGDPNGILKEVEGGCNRLKEDVILQYCEGWECSPLRLGVRS
jgi:hypothetical protein